MEEQIKAEKQEVKNEAPTESPSDSEAGPTREELAISQLADAFKQLGLKAEVVSCDIKGPLVRYSVKPVKVRLQRLQALAEDIALIVGSKAPPIVRPDYESRQIILEMMFDAHPLVEFSKLSAATRISSIEITDKCQIPLLVGTTDIDVPLILDLTNMPHILVAGSTGSGKSMMLHSIINSLEQNYKNIGIEVALIDPKYVEFDFYSNSKMMRYPEVYRNIEDATGVLDELYDQMERRLRVFKKHGCRDILEYRKKVKKIPYIVLVIDEIADLIRGVAKPNKAFKDKLCALAEKSRAAGIHLIIATQHPSAKLLTSEILQNFPCKIACKVSKAVHSRVVLEISGAEKLLGNGDALLLDSTGRMIRFKGAFVSMKDVAKSHKSSIEKKSFFKSAIAIINKNKK